MNFPELGALAATPAAVTLASDAVGDDDPIPTLHWPALLGRQRIDVAVARRYGVARSYLDIVEVETDFNS